MGSIETMGTCAVHRSYGSCGVHRLIEIWVHVGSIEAMVHVGSIETVGLCGVHRHYGFMWGR